MQRFPAVLLSLTCLFPLPGVEGPLRISLREALRTALSQNPQVHQAVLALAQSQEDRNLAQSALLPRVQGVASRQRAQMNLDTFLGRPSPGGPQAIGPFTWGEAQLQAQAPLFDLGLWKRWQAAREGESAARSQGQAVREGIAALVVGQYFQALRASESMRATQSRVEVAVALEKLAEDQQTHGVGTKLDTLRAQVQLQAERQRLIQAQTQYRTALFGLGRLLDLAPGTSLELTDTLATPQLPPFDLQAAYGQGLRQRPELAALDSRERAAQAQQAAARDQRLPSLVATGMYGASSLAAQPNLNVFQVGLSLRIPLFTGGQISAQVAKSRLELERIQTERRDTRARVGLEVQVALEQLEAARSEVGVATQALSLSEEALVQARHRFEAGVSNNIELINAQDEVARAQDNRISALYRMNQARADLAHAMGQVETFFAS
jgi:outer membrane protein